MGRFRPFSCRFFCLLVLCPLFGCGSGYWIEDPHSYYWQDPTFSLERSKKFSIVRFHDIDSSIELPRRTEDAFAYAISNNLIQRGYIYTPFFDSADFILASVATEAYHTRYRVTESIDAIPSLRRVGTIDLASLDFGTAADYPIATPSVGALRCNPYLAVVLYSPRSMRPVYTYTARAVARDTDYRIPLGMLVVNFARKLPFAGTNWKPGSGVLGLWFDIYTVDGENFWPRVTRADSTTLASTSDVRTGDLLIGVDGVDMKNIPFLTLLSHLVGEAGEKKQLVLWRWPGRIMNVTLRMAPRPAPDSSSRIKQ
jgi:hypothetical protein